MKNFAFTSTMAIAATLLLAPTTTFAQMADEMAYEETKYYVGIGYNTYETAGTSGSVDNNTVTFADTDADGFELTFGYRFTDTVSGEFQYAQLAYDDVDETTVSGNLTVTESDTGPDSDILKLSVLFHHIHKDIYRPFVRLGYASADTGDDAISMNTFGNQPTAANTFTLDVNEADGFLWGLGIDFDLPSKITLRAEYQDVGDASGFNLAAIYRF